MGFLRKTVAYLQISNIALVLGLVALLLRFFFDGDVLPFVLSGCLFLGTLGSMGAFLFFRAAQKRKNLFFLLLFFLVLVALFLALSPWIFDANGFSNFIYVVQGATVAIPFSMLLFTVSAFFLIEAGEKLGGTLLIIPFLYLFALGNQTVLMALISPFQIIALFTLYGGGNLWLYFLCRRNTEKNGAAIQQAT